MISSQLRKFSSASSQSVTLLIMTEKGFLFLNKLINKYKSLIGLVVVARDNSIIKDYADDIIELCAKERIDCIERSQLKIIKSEYIVTVSWRWLVNHPEDKIIVFHDSLLPKYRGFAPLVNSLIFGESEIGVTALFGASNFDTGNIIIQFGCAIQYPLKISEAIKINNFNYFKCADYVFEKLLNNEKILGYPQNELNATYSVWRDELDYKIDWRKSATEILRFINAVGFPYKGAFVVVDGKVVRIFDAVEVSDVKINDRHVGKVLFINDGKPVIICGSGLLKIIDAKFDDPKIKKPFLPLNKFRSRFSNDN